MIRLRTIVAVNVSLELGRREQREGRRPSVDDALLLETETTLAALAAIASEHRVDCALGDQRRIPHVLEPCCLREEIRGAGVTGEEVAATKIVSGSRVDFVCE